MDVFRTDRIRNVVLLGHGGAGKTTLAEAMAYLAGLTNRLGRVEDGNTVSDYDKEEIKRHFSITTSLIPVPWQKNKVNILDTPGYFDFVGEVEEAVSAADAAIIVVSGKAGVQVGTQKAWNLCEKYKLPRMIFVTDMDVDDVSYRKVVDQLTELYGKKIAPLHFPIREDGKFVGYVNVVKQAGRRYIDKAGKEPCDVPEYLEEYLEKYHETLMESVAETSEEFMERYFNGEEFSVEAVVVPFDAENGYALAASYEMGKVVDSYGGGICQVSTTLYVAVLKAELEVTERYSHSMIVHYVDPSMDAAIAEGLKDLKFINNTDAPIYIEASADGSTLHFAIYGHETRDPNRTVRYESETTSTEDPTPGLTEDANASFGTIEQTSYGYQGSTARLWKIVNDNGNETKEQVNSSTYRMTSDVYTVGTKTDNAAARAEMQAAIAANDLAKAKEVAAKYSQSSSSSSSSEKKEDSSDDSDSDGTEKTDDSSDTEKTEDDED